METTYPRFFRKDGRALKQDGPTTGIQIEVPKDGEYFPLIHSRVTYPTPERMAEDLATMTPQEPRVWDEFLHTFYEVSRRNEDMWRSHRESRLKMIAEKNNQLSTI